MSYDSRNRLSSHTDSKGQSKALNYDARGNVTQLGGLNFVYDLSDQPVSISGSASGTYKYDGNFKRVKSLVNGKTIYNVYNAAGTLTHVDRLTDNKNTDYIGTIARVTNDVATFLHADHLGSANTGTSANGLISWRQQFTPFGEELITLAVNKDLAGFTGHIKDSATGLNYMQSRYYAPLIGRFLSIDSIGFSVKHPGQFNRYMYGNNDPINMFDPDGRKARSDINHEDIQPRVEKNISRTANQNGSVTSSRTTTVSTPQRTSSSDTGTVTALPQDSANGVPANVPADMESRLFDLSDSADATVEVTSGVRTSEQNAAIGGAPGSSHLVDSAVDIRIPGNTPAQTADSAHESGRFNRVNEYTNGRGVHVDTRATGNQGRFRNWVHQPDP